MQMTSNVHHATYPLCLSVYQSVCVPVSFSQSEVCDSFSQHVCDFLCLASVLSHALTACDECMYEHFSLTREQCEIIYPFDELEQCDPKTCAANTTIGTGSL